MLQHQKIGVVIPGNATMKPELAKRIDSLGIDVGKPTEPPHTFSFHYIDYPLAESLLEDGTIMDSGVYEFMLRDAVIGVLIYQLSKMTNFLGHFRQRAI